LKKKKKIETIGVFSYADAKKKKKVYIFIEDELNIHRRYVIHKWETLFFLKKKKKDDTDYATCSYPCVTNRQ
jgi:hypothetical protein